MFIVELLEDRVPISTAISKVNDHMPSIVVIDDFYTYPEEVRDIALTLDYSPSNWHKGKRTKSKLILDGTKEKLEKIYGKEILGYRAPGAYIGDWMIQSLVKLGFKYDSSIAANSLYNKTNFSTKNISSYPYWYNNDNVKIFEIPWSYFSFLKFRFPSAFLFSIILPLFA